MQFIETSVSQPFISEVAQADDTMNLARAGLLFAMSEYPKIDCAWYLGQLDLIAHEITTRLGGSVTVNERLAALNSYLYSDLGFSGNVDDYYDPRNSYLNEVIDRRVGLPITLSIVYLELAHRLAIPASGISFPGHFLVGATTELGDVIVDPFDRGAALPRETFVQRLRERTHQDTAIEALERALQPASKVEILLRQLRNLKAVYAQKGLVEKNLNTLNHMLAIDVDLMPELLDRAALYDSLGYARGAVEDYTRGLELLPLEANREEVSARLRSAKTKASHLH